MKYMRDDIEDVYDIAKLQDKILEIMVDIDKFCAKFNIDYCLMAGSALGARRHKGFIPWDDDMDIYMTENDYSKFKKSFEKFGNKNKYYLQEWGYIKKGTNEYITLAKIRMNNTCIEEELFKKLNIHKGIFVDIFIMHSCPNNKLLQVKQYLWGEAVVLKGLTIRNYIPKSCKDRFLLGIGKMLPLEWVKYHGLKNNYKYKDKLTNYISGFIDTRKFSRAVFPRNTIFPTKYVDFEKVKLKVPNDLDTYLKIQFGNDYMTLPPEEKRPIHKHGGFWKLSVKNESRNFSDEDKLI